MEMHAHRDQSVEETAYDTYAMIVASHVKRLFIRIQGGTGSEMAVSRVFDRVMVMPRTMLLPEAQSAITDLVCNPSDELDLIIGDAIMNATMEASMTVSAIYGFDELTRIVSSLSEIAHMTIRGSETITEEVASLCSTKTLNCNILFTAFIMMTQLAQINYDSGSGVLPEGALPGDNNLMRVKG